MIAFRRRPTQAQIRAGAKALEVWDFLRDSPHGISNASIREKIARDVLEAARTA